MRLRQALPHFFEPRIGAGQCRIELAGPAAVGIGRCPAAARFLAQDIALLLPVSALTARLIYLQQRVPACAIEFGKCCRLFGCFAHQFSRKRINAFILGAPACIELDHHSLGLADRAVEPGDRFLARQDGLIGQFKPVAQIGGYAARALDLGGAGRAFLRQQFPFARQPFLGLLDRAAPDGAKLCSTGADRLNNLNL